MTKNQMTRIANALLKCHEKHKDKRYCLNKYRISDMTNSHHFFGFLHYDDGDYINIREDDYDDNENNVINMVRNDTARENTYSLFIGDIMLFEAPDSNIHSHHSDCETHKHGITDDKPS